MRLSEAVKQAGVVGAGGAGFPTHVKLESEAKVLVVNGAECEPLLRVDQQLLASEIDTILAAVDAISTEMSLEQVYIGIKGKHKQLVSQYQNINDPKIKVSVLGDFFPAGDEHILVREVTGRTIPAGGIPLNVGVVVLNAETVYNIGRAIKGIPVTEKFVTVTGAVRDPKTLKVPVGTPIAELLEFCGGSTVPDAVFIDGGPMMGRIVDKTAIVSKVTKGILVLPPDLNLIIKRQADWSVVKRLAYHCEICQTCTDFCPRHLQGHGLEPHKMMRYLAYGGEKVDSQDFLGALLCAECGVCENFACPVNIFPRQVVSYFKKQLASRRVRYPAGRPLLATGPASDRRVPTGRLVARLGLTKYDRPAPLTELEIRPKRVDISLRPPFGAACRPLVQIGQRVQAGEQLGETPDGALGSHVHASIDGTVKEVNDMFVVLERN